jgi:hypothetical protein
VTTTTTYTDDLLSTSFQCPDTASAIPLLRLTPEVRNEGDKILFTARLAGQVDADEITRMAIRVDAVKLNPDGPATVVRGCWATVNHDGSSYGTQYIAVRSMIEFPETGEWTVTLRYEGTSQKRKADGSLITLTPQPTLTYLKASSLLHTESERWTNPDAACVGWPANPVTDPDCPQCTAPLLGVRVLERDFDIPANLTQDKATVVAEIELSREYGSYPGGDSVLDVILNVLPYDQATDTYGNQVIVTPASSTTITSSKHHLRLNLVANLVDLEEFPRVKVWVDVNWVSGNPVAIDDYLHTDAAIMWY